MITPFRVFSLTTFHTIALGIFWFGLAITLPLLAPPGIPCFSPNITVLQCSKPALPSVLLSAGTATGFVSDIVLSSWNGTTFLTFYVGQLILSSLRLLFYCLLRKTKALP